MAKVCNAATALHINQYNSIASIVHTHNNWHTKHDLHLHHMSVTLSTTMSFILSASMSVINHYVRHRVAGVYKCHIWWLDDISWWEAILCWNFFLAHYMKNFYFGSISSKYNAMFFSHHLPPVTWPPATWNLKCENYGQVGYPWKELWKCSSAALTLPS